MFVINIILPLCLLIGAVLRQSLISFGYLLFFLLYFLIKPIKSVPISGSDNRRHRKYVLKKIYWISLVVYCLCICIGHVIFQMFLLSHSIQDNNKAELVGYHSLDSATTILSSLVVDAIMFCVSLICLLYLSRHASKARAPVPIPHELAHKGLLFILVFTCGVANPSFLSAPYFICFIIYMYLWATRTESFGLEIPRINPLVTIYILSHIIFIYLYQFKFIEESISDELADMLGLYLTRQIHTDDVPALISSLSQILLYMVICRSEEEREAIDIAAETNRTLLRLATRNELRRQRTDTKLNEPPLSLPDNNNKLRMESTSVSISTNPNKENNDDVDLSPFTRDESARQSLNRIIRGYGRFLCLISLIISAFLNPTWLSAGMLVIFSLGVTLSRSSFDRISPLTLMYVTIVNILTYLYTIPHFLPTSDDLDTVGLARHSPYPVYYLVVAILPVITIAGYSRLKRITNQDLYFYDILNGVAVGDLQLLRRAIADDNKLVHKQTTLGQTPLHIAASHGQSRMAVFLLENGALPVIQDRNGNTPLHLSYQNCHDETSLVILNHSKAREYREELYNIKNNMNICFHEVEYGAAALARASLYRVYKFFEVMALKHADKLSLSVLFVAGLDRVNVFNSGYIIFFMLFFPFPNLAKRGWNILVMYAGVVLLLQYSWSVYFASSDIDTSKRYPWSKTWGFVHANNLWKDLFLYYAVLILSAIQLSVYRRLSLKTNIISKVREGRYFESRWVNRLLVIISNILKVNGLPLCYVLFVIAALSDVSVVKMGYLVLLIFCFLVHQLAPTSLTFWKRYWVLVVMYTTIVLLVVYVSQFEGVQHWLVQHWPKSWLQRMPITAFGFVKHEGRSSLLSFLLLPAAVYVASVLELRVLWDQPIKSIFDETSDVRSSKLKEPLLSSPADLHSRAKLLNQENEVLVSSKSNIFDDENNMKDEARKHRLTDDSMAWWEIQVLNLTSTFTSVIVNHIGKVLAIFIWITISAIENANVLNAGFLILLILFLPIKRGRFLWVPIMFYGSIVLLIRYGFQFPDPASRINKQTEWIGIKNFHNELYRNLLAEVTILALCTIQRYSQRVLEDVLRKNARTKINVVQPIKQQGYYIESKDTVEIAWTKQIWIFLTNIWAWSKYLLSNIYDSIGIQLTLTMLLVDAFARCNALSVIQVFAVIYYLIYNEKNIQFWWKILAFIMFIALVGQYFLAMGPRPGTKFPFSNLKTQDARWLLLSGYSSVDLNWDFFALLALLVQMRHFANNALKMRRKDYRDNLNLDDNDDEYDELHPKKLPISGNPSGWYNTFFKEFPFYFYVSFDKIIIIIVFYAGTRKPSVLNVGYVMMALGVLMRKGIISASLNNKLRGTSFMKYRNAWSRIALYNAYIMFARILYQIPWIPNEYYESPVVRWERMVGLNQYTASDKADIAKRSFEGGTLYSIILFLFIDLMLYVFDRPGYDVVLKYYQNNRIQAEYRGPESAQQRKLIRITQLAHLMNKRKFFRERLYRVQSRMREFGTDVDIKELFPDTEIWPTKPPEGTSYETMNQWQNDPLPPEMVGLLSREALEEFEPELKARGIEISDDSINNNNNNNKDDDNNENINDGNKKENILDGDLLDVIEDTEEVSDENDSWFGRKIKIFDNILRRYFIARIDMTLWMIKERDLKTGALYDSQPPLDNCSTISLFRRFLTSKSEMVCYILFMINLYANGSIIELFIPFLIFSYALMESPRAPKSFWRFAMTYLGVIISLKFLFQLEAFCVTIGHHKYALQPSPYCATINYGYTAEQEVAPDYLFGIYKTNGNSFFAYIFWDLICLIACVWHRMLMISKGVWYQNEEYLGDNILQQQQPYRSISFVRKSIEIKNENENEKKEESKSLTEKTKRKPTVPVEMLQTSFHKASESSEEYLQKFWIRFMPMFIRNYYFSLIPRDKDNIYIIKPGHDYYGITFVFELFCAFYLLFFYPRMATTSQSTVASAISSNMFSGYMVLALLCQMIIITLDRVFYLYRSLRWKLLLQYITLIYWLGLMLISWPKASQLLFIENSYLRFFFFLKCIYFTLSGLQIRYGYPSIEKTGFQYIMRKPGILRAYMFRIYRALPFVFEMRSLLDWMAHESSLDLWEHLKLEDIHSNMFLAQCDIIYRKMHPRGSAQPGYMRFINGALIFALLMLVIFLPLIFFSSANPATQGNPVEAASIVINVIGPAGTYKLLSIASIAGIQPVDDTTFNELKGERIIADDAQKNVQNITLVPWADAYWDISPLSRQMLMQSLREPDVVMKMQISYSFTREKPADHRISTDDNVVLMNQTLQSSLADIIDQNTASKEITIPSLIPTYLRLPSNGPPIILTTNRQNAVLRMEPPSSNGESYWQIYSNFLENIGPVFITISNPVFQNPLGLSTYAFSVVGLYSLVVLTVARLVRLNFGGLMFLIPFEDLHDVDDLVSVCEGVLIARYTKQYMKEERLYRQLIWIYRTPPLLRRITRRKDDY